VYRTPARDAVLLLQKCRLSLSITLSWLSMDLGSAPATAD
jgi:hypothetical protein